MSDDLWLSCPVPHIAQMQGCLAGTTNSPDYFSVFSFFPSFPTYNFFLLNILVPSHANNPSLFTLSSLALDWLPLYAENGEFFWCGKMQIW